MFPMYNPLLYLQYPLFNCNDFLKPAPQNSFTNPVRVYNVVAIFVKVVCIYTVKQLPTPATLSSCSSALALKKLIYNYSIETLTNDKFSDLSRCNNIDLVLNLFYLHK